MEEVHILMFQDLHVADKAPPFRKDDYLGVVEAKLSQLKTIVEKLGVQAVINAGDTFHRKKPGENSHLLVQNVIKWFKDIPCPLYGVVGNHDITRDDLESLKKQPLGTVIEAGAMQRLEGVTVKLPGLDGFEVWLNGLDFRRDISEVRLYLESLSKIPKKTEEGNPIVLVTTLHQYACAGEEGKVFDEAAIGYDEFDRYRPDVYVLGHDHRNLGCGKTKGGKALLRPGALTRGSISYEDITRKPSCGWLKITKDDVVVKTVVLKYREAKEVFDFALKVQKSAAEATQNMFVEELEKVTQEEGVDVFTWLRKKEVSPKVKQKVLELLESQGVKEGE